MIGAVVEEDYKAGSPETLEFQPPVGSVDFTSLRPFRQQLMSNSVCGRSTGFVLQWPPSGSQHGPTARHPTY